MKIENEHLYYDDGKRVTFIPSPHMKGKNDIRYIIIHYTNGPTKIGAIETLTNKKSLNKASAHFVVDRDKDITQLVPMGRIANHSGKSRIGRITFVDKYAIGIEIVNEGLLKRLDIPREDNIWIAPLSRRVYSDDEVLVGKHKFGTIEYGWQLFTEIQLDTVFQLVATLSGTYDIRDIVGHDEIAPKRKWDPGPAFPIEELRKQILGREEPSFQIVIPE